MSSLSLKHAKNPDKHSDSFFSLERVAAENLAYRYIFLAQLVWYTYDWLLSVSEECEVTNGLSWPIAIYFMSRVCTFSQMLCIMLLYLTPSILGCARLSALFLTFGCLAGSCTSLLFFIRVRAVYLCSRSITATFVALWMATIALNLLNTAYFIQHVAGSQSCGIVDSLSIFMSLPDVGYAVYDTLVFLAISYNLAADAAAPENGWRARMQSLLSSESRYTVSNALMRSGQLYYFTTVLAFSANFVLMYSSLAPAPYRSLCINAVPTFASIMACRVFRGVALETMGQDNSLADPSTTGTGMAAALQLATLPSSRSSAGSRHRD